MNSLDRRLCVAPMMDWTDRHCRYVHRLYSPHALLYTEMIVATAILRGDAKRLLAHDPAEYPLALQLGGCDPKELAAAARIGADAGYSEINMNVGCPSERVKNGAFGACLMAEPELVADCVAAMRNAVSVPVTVKTRIGIDARDDFEFLADFARAIAAAGADALIVHARKAMLSGLSPKENREIPALNYEYVYRLKREFPLLPIVLNGGVQDRATAQAAIDQGLDGVMLGRAAYHRPAILAEFEAQLIDPDWREPDLQEVLIRVTAYAERELRKGARLHAIARHLHGLVCGRPGARAWRQYLSKVAARPGAGADILLGALPLLREAA
jgi:tRNA-dihydrouridine synthase A